VQITVITKTEITGDNPQFDKFTSASNQISVNKYWDKLRIYDYTVPRSLLHSKLVLVDGKISVIGSVNLNRRSFYHDVENASIVYSPEFNQQLSAMFQEFLTLSKPVESKKRVGFLKRLVVSIIDKEL
jgi:phosphatidylserine/phosphatidylglycerophosphate/cardiolipin synthase-like enzyme